MTAQGRASSVITFASKSLAKTPTPMIPKLNLLSFKNLLSKPAGPTKLMLHKPHRPDYDYLPKLQTLAEENLPYLKKQF